MVASAGLALYLVWRSLGWPLIHDAPLMHYVAWLITQGAVPYRDVFDMNLPGVYLVHLAVVKTLGEGSMAWRLFDLGWLAATAAALWGFSRRMGDDWSGLGAALLFILYHLAGGAWRVGQRDFLLALLLVLAAWGVARSWETGEILVPLAWGGLAAGAGIMIKPHVAAFWLACAPVVILGASRARRSAVAAVAVWTGAGLAVPLLVLGWLAMRGGLGAFADITTGYLLPLYSRVGGEPIWQVMRGYAYGWQIWICLVALALLGAAQRIPAPY
ncbi:MAG TPA: glycosyltransferase family 39 protein, partial [Verrucomicrobiae bacterium]|nr:glycosyltransferase family 39 protein [Verrucomicrobiae bacterium]